MHHIEFSLRRELLGLSQSQLAETLGVKQNTLSNWEHGKRQIPAEALLQLGELEILAANRMHEIIKEVKANPTIRQLGVWPTGTDVNGLPATIHNRQVIQAVIALKDELDELLEVVPAEEIE